jgi:hypothetical protein
MQPEPTLEVPPRIDRIPYFPQMPIFPIGGHSMYALEGLTTQEIVWRGQPYTAFIDQGQFAVSISNELPLKLSKRQAHYPQNQGPHTAYDGHEFASLAEAGQVFTEAYNTAKPAGLDATVITPNGKLIRLPERADIPLDPQQPVETGETVRYYWRPYTLFAPLLRPGNEVELYDFKTGPFAGYSMLCLADGGVLKPTIAKLARYAINSVASAIWLQSFPLDETDEQGILVASKFV